MRKTSTDKFTTVKKADLIFLRRLLKRKVYTNFYTNTIHLTSLTIRIFFSSKFNVIPQEQMVCEIWGEGFFAQNLLE